MPRRIEVELTSTRDDGTWTWRAAGAKQPKGELDGGLLYPGAKVGDVVRADAEFFVDGITVIAVLPPKEKHRNEPERIEVLGTPRRDDELVTTTLVGKGGRDRDRGERRERGERGGDRRGRPEGGRGPRGPRTEGGRGRGPGGEPARGGERPDRRRERPARPERPAQPARPKPPRLKAGRSNRNAVLASMPEEHKAIAEQVLRGGIPAVRTAVDKQNEAHRAAGEPPINPAPILAIAEDLLPRLRSAEWRDRAEAALAGADDVDLRDLRSVVVAAEQGARDDEARALAEQVRDALNRRVEAEHAAWLAEIDEMLRDNRVVRALRLSSRPPKAGAPLPAELAARLVEASSAALTADIGQDRFAAVLDALAFAPVHAQVSAQGVPADPGDELLAAVKKASARVPQIAAQFGITPTKESGRTRRTRGRGAKPAPPPPPPPPPAAPAESAGAPAETSAEPVPAEPESASTEPASEEPVPAESAGPPETASPTEPTSGDSNGAPESASTEPASAEPVPAEPEVASEAASPLEAVPAEPSGAPQAEAPPSPAEG